MTITKFLLARIAEDEETANETLESYPEMRDYDATDAGSDYAGVVITPRRVLAECAAKRAIVEQHPIHVYQGLHGQEVPECAVGDGFPCDTLQALAAVYADHPDYLQEWAC